MQIKSRRGLPKTREGVSRATSSQLRYSAKDFITEWVNLTDLPNDSSRRLMENELVQYRESYGRNIKTHQFRTSFAHFCYRVDPRLLSILQMHFHHVSVAMTDGGYLRHAHQIRDTNDMRYQHAALLALEIANGDSRMAGRGGEHLETKIKMELGPRIEGQSRASAYQEAFLYVEESGLDQLFFEPHGLCCALSASQMACHREAGSENTARWHSRLKPNYETRTPTLCAGCESFAIARWHLPFWEQRYIDHMAEIRQMEEYGISGPEFENANVLTLARARQAYTLCRKLGSDLDDLEHRLNARVKEVMLASQEI